MARTRSIKWPNSEGEIDALFDKIQRTLTNKCIVSGALAIKGAASAIVKFVNALYFLQDAQLYTKAAADCTALAGTVTNAKFNVFVFTVDNGGTLRTRMGTEAATLGAVAFPTIPDGEVTYGFIVVNPTGTGNFVGGTTALDDATVVPNVVYINTTYGFNTALATL